MNLQLKQFTELSTSEVFELLKLRQDVFCIEQRCLYPDIDETDKIATHCLAFQDNTLVAYARIYTTVNNTTHIGRIVVNINNRGDKIGKKMVQHCIDYCQKTAKNHRIEISAQMHLMPYYQGLGFKECNTSYFEDGIPHIKMIHQKGNN